MAPLPCLPRMFHFTKAPARALPGAQAANSLWTRFGEALVIQPGVAWCERSFIHEGHA